VTAFTLRIDLGNAAMQTGDDVAEALEYVATRLRVDGQAGQVGLIRDLNGNTVGNYHLPNPPQEEDR